MMTSQSVIPLFGSSGVTMKSPPSSHRSTSLRSTSLIRNPLHITKKDETPLFLNHVRRKPKVAAFLRGKEFEHEIYTLMLPSYPDLLYQPLYSYNIKSEPRRRYCLPDIIVRGANAILCCEVKIRHTSEAESQLFDLYLPLLRQLHPKEVVVGVEIVRHFDPDVRSVRIPRLIDHIDEVIEDPVLDDFNVLVWNDGRLF